MRSPARSPPSGTLPPRLFPSLDVSCFPLGASLARVTLLLRSGKCRATFLRSPQTRCAGPEREQHSEIDAVVSASWNVVARSLGSSVAPEEAGREKCAIVTGNRHYRDTIKRAEKLPFFLSSPLCESRPLSVLGLFWNRGPVVKNNRLREKRDL